MNEYLELAESLWAGAPRALQAIAILAAGTFLAFLARKATHLFLRLARFDKFAERFGFAEFLRKGNAAYRPASLVGVVVFWIVMIATFLSVSRTLDIAAVNQLASSLGAAVPGVIAAAFIVFVGIVCVVFLGNVVETVSRNAAFRYGRLVASVVRYAGSLVLVLLVLDLVGLGQSLISFLVMIAFSAIALAFALAFGLGCKDLAREAMQEFFRNLREKEREKGKTDLEG